jgi:riboflavin biosynthesis pyrimidine reductase
MGLLTLLALLAVCRPSRSARPGTFVITGLPDIVTATRERAEAASLDDGVDLDVVLMGGGSAIGSELGAGLVDAPMLHLAPVVLGAGTSLFIGGVVQRSVTSTSTATHLT